MGMKIVIVPFSVTQHDSGEESTKSENLSNLKLCSLYTNALYMNNLGDGKTYFFYYMPKST